MGYKDNQEKKKCSDHRIEFQEGDPARSVFGCTNCDEETIIQPEDAGTGA